MNPFFSIIVPCCDVELYVRECLDSIADQPFKDWECLLGVINVLADSLGLKPKMEMLPMQPGDVYATYASIEKLNKAVGYEPTTPISVGMPKFIAWFKEWRGRATL